MRRQRALPSAKLVVKLVIGVEEEEEKLLRTVADQMRRRSVRVESGGIIVVVLVLVLVVNVFLLRRMVAFSTSLISFLSMSRDRSWPSLKCTIVRQRRERTPERLPSTTSFSERPPRHTPAEERPRRAIPTLWIFWSRETAETRREEDREKVVSV